jgi:hypothetical protein
MVDILSMVDLTSISAILAAIGVLVGVVFAILELRNLVKTRQTDRVVRLYSIMGSKDWLEAWDKFVNREMTDFYSYKKKYGFAELNTVLTIFEGIGVLLRRKLIDVGLVQDFFSFHVNLVWEKLKPFAEEARQIRKTPKVATNVEYLYNEMKKREQQTATI